MSDDVAITPGTGASIAADEISGVKYQRMKLIHGNDGENAGDVSTTNPLPVILAADTDVNIGSVDIVSMIPGTASDELGKASDAPASGGDTGISILGVRNNNAATSLADTDGDYCPISVDANGIVFVYVTGVAPGTAASSLGKAEDAAHASGDTGVFMLAIRNDDLGTGLSNTNGDYTGIAVDNTGCVFVRTGVTGQHLAKLEDAAHSSGDAGVMLLGVRNDSLGTTFSDTNGDYTPISTDSKGLLWVRTGTDGSHLAKLEDAAHVSGDAGVMLLAIRNDSGTTLTNTDGDYSGIAVNSTGKVLCVATGSGANGASVSGNPVLVAGSDGTNTRTLSTTTAGRPINAHTYLEDDAHSSGDRGAFVLGVRNDTAVDTTTTDGDYSYFTTNKKGELRVVSGGMVEVAQTKTRPNDTNVYAVNDVINESTSAGTAYTFSNCARYNGGSGTVIRAMLDDSANKSTKLQAFLLLFKTTPSVPGNDNVAVALADSDNPVAIIPLNYSYILNTASDASGACVLDSGIVNKPFTCDSSSTTLYGMLIAANAYTPVGNEVLNIRLQIQQD